MKPDGVELQGGQRDERGETMEFRLAKVENGAHLIAGRAKRRGREAHGV